MQIKRTVVEQEHKHTEKDSDGDLERMERLAAASAPLRWKIADSARRKTPIWSRAGSPLAPEIESRARKEPIFVARGDSKATVRVDKNPKPGGSFGFAGIFVSVNSKVGLLDGILCLPIPMEAVKKIDLRTVRVFRWSEEDRRFEPQTGSRVSQKGSVAWVRISRPGRYTLIGLPQDPRVIATIRMLKSTRDLGGSSEALEQMRNRICQVILCQDSFGNVYPGDGYPENRFPPGPGWGSGGKDPGFGWNPGGVCKLCEGLDETPLPEEDLIDPPVRIPQTGESTTPWGDHWEYVGPLEFADPIMDLQFDPRTTDRIYAVSRYGGLWVLPSIQDYPRRTWRSLTDGLDRLDGNALAIAPSDPDRLYLGLGDGTVRESRDRGRTWTTMAHSFFTSDSNYTPIIARIVVDPRDSGRVFVASQAGLWIFEPQTGHWTQLLNEDATDVVLDPDDPELLYVGSRIVVDYDRNTNPWTPLYEGHIYGMRYSPGTGALGMASPVHSLSKTVRSEVGGARVRLALGRKRNGSLERPPNRTVVAKIGATLWLNRAGGDQSSWSELPSYVATMRSTEDSFSSENGWYDADGWQIVLGVDPHDATRIFAGQLDLYLSENDGATFTKVAGRDNEPHADMHCLLFDPAVPGLVYMGQDAGVYRSNDGVIWPQMVVNNRSTYRNEVLAKRCLNEGLTTTELFRVGILGSTAMGNANHLGTLTCSDLTAKRWLYAHRADGTLNGWGEFDHILAHPKRSHFYALTGGHLHRRTLEGEWEEITTGAYRVMNNWFALPLAIDPNSGSTLLLACGANEGTEAHPIYRLYVVDDGSPAATRWTVALGLDRPFVAASFVPGRPGEAYAITNRGELYHGEGLAAGQHGTWSLRVTWPPQSDEIRQLIVNPNDANRVYVMAKKHIVRFDPAAETAGETASPDAGFEHYWIAMHPQEAHTLFLASGTGVFVSEDEGEHWEAFDDGLPHALVFQAIPSEGYLYAVLHGRGLWRRRLPD